MRNIIKIIVAAIIFTAVSCGSFKDRYSVDENIELTKDNMHLLKGSYQAKTSKTIQKFDSRKSFVIENDSLNRHNLFHFIGGGVSPDNGEDDQSVYFDIEDKDSITIRFVKNDTIVSSRRLRYKVKKGYAYVYCEKPNFKIRNIPLLYGGFEVSKMRLGLNKNKDLIAESTYYIFGAVLVIIGDSRSHRSSSLYKRKS